MMRLAIIEWWCRISSAAATAATERTEWPKAAAAVCYRCTCCRLHTALWEIPRRRINLSWQGLPLQLILSLLLKNQDNPGPVEIVRQRPSSRTFIIKRTSILDSFACWKRCSHSLRCQGTDASTKALHLHPSALIRQLQ